VWREHFRNPALRASFAIGFCILFAFIGTFTYVNFVLVSEPLSLSRMALGFVYFVFVPSIVTTPLAGHAVAALRHPAHVLVRARDRGGRPAASRRAQLPAVAGGARARRRRDVLAQAIATGFRRRGPPPSTAARPADLSRVVLRGGLVGSAVLGQVFDRLGWTACVAGIGLALALAALLAARLELPMNSSARVGP
jgi:hypothetical protein